MNNGNWSLPKVIDDLALLEPRWSFAVKFGNIKIQYMFFSWKSLKAALHLIYFKFPNIAQLGVGNVVPVHVKCCKQLNKGSFFKIKTNSKIHFKSASTCKTAPWHCTRELWWINWVHKRYCFSALALISCSKWLIEPQSRQCPQQILSKLTQVQSITLIEGSPHLEAKKMLKH